MTRPKEIYWFAIIQLASLAVGLYSAVSDWDGLIAGANVGGQMSGEMVNNIALFTMIFSFGINLVLLTLIWLRNNVARWIYIIIGLLGTVMGVGALTGATFGKAEIIAAIQLAVGLALVGILFLPNVTQWFARRDDTSTFS